MGVRARKRVCAEVAESVAAAEEGRRSYLCVWTVVVGCLRKIVRMCAVVRGRDYL